MQLDRTHVVIRRRSLSEIGDLSLVMLRRYPAALFIGFALGALPWFIANAILLSWIPMTQWEYGFTDDESTAELWRYTFWMITLVTLQSPAAGVVTTMYLGQAVFESQPTWRSVFKETQKLFPRWFWVLGVMRFAIPAMVVCALRYQQPPNWFWDFFVPILFLGAMAIVRSNRPFLPEILVLEQCPIKATHDSTITLGRRSRALHQPMASDLGGRFLTTSFLLFWILFSFVCSFVFLRVIASGVWDLDLFFYLAIIPLSLWLAAGISVFIRLLNYLDSRIRLEGWEVELAVRAEAIRQFGEEGGLSHPVATRQTPTSQVKPPKSDMSRAEELLEKARGVEILGAKPLLILLFSLLVFQTPSKAETLQGADAKPSFAEGALSSSPWYDPKQETVVPVTVETTVDDSVNRNSRWLPKPKRIQAKPTTNATTAPSGGGWFGTDLSLTNLIAWFCLVLLVIGIVGLLVFVLSKTDIDLGNSPSSKSGASAGGGPDEQTIERMKHLPAELRRTDVNLRSEALRLMNLGEFDQAVILLFAHQLLLLDRSSLLRLTRGKTNGAYVREARKNDNQIGVLLRETTTAFEKSYFGRHTITRSEFEQLWKQNETIENKVQTLHEVAA